MYVIDSADLYRVNTPVIGTDIFWQIKFYLLTAMHHYWFLHMLQKNRKSQIVLVAIIVHINQGTSLITSSSRALAYFTKSVGPG